VRSRDRDGTRHHSTIPDKGKPSRFTRADAKAVRAVRADRAQEHEEKQRDTSINCSIAWCTDESCKQEKPFGVLSMFSCGASWPVVGQAGSSALMLCIEVGLVKNTRFLRVYTDTEYPDRLAERLCPVSMQDCYTINTLTRCRWASQASNTRFSPSAGLRLRAYSSVDM
jgi:hypothetical protein